MKSTEVDVLLVEDNPTDAELTLRLLRKHRLANRLLHAKDGEEAIALLCGPDFDHLPGIVLLDIQLPKADGFEVLKRLRANEYARHTAVIMLTSTNEDPMIRKSYELGANSYIVKPLSFDKFMDAVKNLSFSWMLLSAPPAQA